MELTPVKSSNIAGAEYLAGDQVMLIRYHDGALYARLRVTPGQYVGFMAAPSKGAFVHAMPNRALLISNPRKEGAPIEVEAERGAVEGQAAAPLNVIDEEADPCCRCALRGIVDLLPNIECVQLGELTCKECGTAFAPEMVGPVRHWRIKPWVAIVRPR